MQKQDQVYLNGVSLNGVNVDESVEALYNLEDEVLEDDVIDSLDEEYEDYGYGDAAIYEKIRNTRRDFV